MIDARELRIGNYVCCRIGIENAKKYSPFGVIVSVSEAHTCAINYNVPPEIRSLFYKGKFEDDFNPIPLTEEILIKCGFVKVGYSNPHTTQWKLGDILIGFCNGTIYFDYININGVKKGCCYQHLHHLQNLYFALTGHELNLNL